MTIASFFSRRRIAFVLPVALIIAIAQNIGREVQQFQGIRYTNILFYLSILLQFILYFLLITIVFTFLETRKNDRVSGNIDLNEKYIGVLCQITMLICWLPVFLASYPGFFCYDAGPQLEQVIQQAYTTHHPLLHTFLLGNFLVIFEKIGGSYNLGVTVFVSLQAVLLTKIFTEIILEIGKNTRKIWTMIIIFLYYAFFPTIVMFGLCTTKDTLFSAFLVLHILYLMRLINTDSKKEKLAVKVIVSAVLTMLFRNNGVYAFALFYVLIAIMDKGLRKIYIKILFFGLGSFFLLSSFLGLLLKAEKTDMREMFSIPAQQIARVYHEKGSEYFQAEDRELLYKLIPEDDLHRYNEKLADPVKANLHIGFNSTLKDFLYLWLKYGIKQPDIYADALFMQTYQAYYPQAIIDGYCGVNAKPRYKDSQTCYFSCDVEAPAYSDSKLPHLLDFYYSLSRQITFQNIPVVSFLFSIGGMLYILLFSFSYSLYMKKKTHAAGCGIILCICLTSLLGPIVLIRYYLILFFAFPLIISTVFLSIVEK